MTTTEQLLDREGLALSALMHPTIPLIQEECWQIAEEHGFHEVGQSIGDKLMLIVSEAAEALEDHRDGHHPSEIWYTGKTGRGDFLELSQAEMTRRSEQDPDGVLVNPKPCGIPSEIADIIIRCFDFAGCYGIDLESIILQKMDFNRTRPFLHGRTM